jgi:hypothetical protein
VSLIPLNDYDSLMLSLIGGELTLITIVFTLLPIIADKKDEYYLCFNKKEFYLFDGKTNKMTLIWIIGLILIFASAIFCYFKLNIFGYIFVGIFIVFISYYIISFLNFISNTDIINSLIEKQFLKDVKTNYNYTIGELVKTSIINRENIINDMNYLSNLDDKGIFNDYCNQILQNSDVDKFVFLQSLSKIIKDHKYNFEYKVDNWYIYILIRNNINDYNKEYMYEIIYNLTFNNFNNLIYSKSVLDDEYFITLILKAINDSSLSDENKKEVKSRTLRNILYSYNFSSSKDDSDNIKNKTIYEFRILKYLIDNKDFNQFNLYLRNYNAQIEKTDIENNIFILLISYFYYLIKIEKIGYVSLEEKNIFQKMFNSFYNNNSFSEYYSNEYYRKNLKVVFEILDSVSNDWEKFDLSTGSDVKTMMVEPMINTIKKVLILFFCKDITGKHYIIDKDIAELFKLDFEDGKLKTQFLDEINKFADFVEFKDYNLESFQSDYLLFLDQNYKNISNIYKINEINVKDKLQNQVDKLEIDKLPIFNSKRISNANLKELTYTFICSNNILNSFSNFVSNTEILNRLQVKICDDINSSINNKIEYKYGEEQRIFNELEKALNNNLKIYIKPNYDSLLYIIDDQNRYKKILSKFQIINVNCSKYKFLLEDFKCKFVSAKVYASKLDEKEISDIVKNEKIVKNNKFCIQNYEGFDILYTKEELEDYIYRTQTKIKIKINYSLLVKGQKNVSIRKIK